LDFAAGLVLGCLLGVMAVMGTLLLIAAASSEHARKTKGLSPSGLAIAASVILAVTLGARLVHLRDGSLVLLLFLIVLTVSRLRGLRTGLAVSLFAVLVLSVVFRPAWSLKVTRPGDQLLLALFILGGALGSHLASSADRSAERAGDLGGLESKRTEPLVIRRSYPNEEAS
jgi:K+-sensing histidine kinase KdpD